jgi:Fic family protein
MHAVRGVEKRPGELRRSQNWIGSSRPGNAAYVPPPPSALAGLLRAFGAYLRVDDALPPLVRAGFLHAQFETTRTSTPTAGSAGCS